MPPAPSTTRVTRTVQEAHAAATSAVMAPEMTATALGVSVPDFASKAEAGRPLRYSVASTPAGDAVGDAVGDAMGDAVGDAVDDAVGDALGVPLGEPLCVAVSL